MASEPGKPAKRLLDPVDRVSEVLFGLIMVLTFTGSLSVAEAGRDDVREMLVGALGCNLAWGVIDALFYLMGCIAERSHNLRIYRAVRSAADPERAQRLLAEVLPPVVASVLQPAELDSIRRRLALQPEPPEHARLHKDDWLGALGVSILVFLSTFPVVIPFIFMHSIQPAMRVSNVIAVTLLLVAGYAFGRITGRNPWVTGITMVVFGAILVAFTIALGG